MEEQRKMKLWSSIRALELRPQLLGWGTESLWMLPGDLCFQKEISSSEGGRLVTFCAYSHRVFWSQSRLGPQFAETDFWVFLYSVLLSKTAILNLPSLLRPLAHHFPPTWQREQTLSHGDTLSFCLQTYIPEVRMHWLLLPSFLLKPLPPTTPVASFSIIPSLCIFNLFL